MKTSDKGLDLIKSFEGFSSAPYLCPANVATIGYGSTRYADGTKVTLQDKTITEAEAVALLAKTLEGYETNVLDCVDVHLEQNEFDALVSLSYNIGRDAFKNSTLVKLLNKQDYIGAGMQILKWDKVKGKPMAGLTRRRMAEREMFING